MAWRFLLQAVSASSTATTPGRRVAFVPEQHTDFIFSVVPESVSIFRLAVTILLVLLLIWILRRRRRARQDPVDKEPD